jgi:hypothetical protein
MYNGLSRTSQTDIKFTLHPHSTPFLDKLLGDLLETKAQAALRCRDHISELNEIPLLTIGDAVSNSGSLFRQNTFDSKDTIDVEQQDLLINKSSPRAVTGWRWALAVSAILSSLFLFALNNTIVADIQPAIVEAFNNIGKLSWLRVALLLSAAFTNLVSVFF